MVQYHFSMKLLHWLMAILLISMLAVGIWMQGLPADTSYKYTVYDIHKSFGLIALALVIIRIINRVLNYIPALPPSVNRFDKTLSAITIFLLYVCMVLEPISGYLMSSLSGYDVKFFTINTPKFLAVNTDLAILSHKLHFYFGYLMLILIGMHIAGTVKHYVFEKVNLLKRIT